MSDLLNNAIFATVIKSAVVIFALLTMFAYLTLIERRVVAKIQGRLGPNRAGPFGLLQPLADAVKMACKEQIIPYTLASQKGNLSCCTDHFRHHRTLSLCRYTRRQ